MAGIIAGVIIGIILLAVVLVPIVNDGLVKEKSTLDSSSFTYYATTDMDGQVYSVDSSGHLLYNGEDVGNTAVHIISDKFRVMYYNGTLTMFDSTMTTNPSVKTLTINADGSYTVVNTSDVTIESTSTLEWFAGPTSDTNAKYVEVLMPAFSGKFDPTSVIYGGFYGSVTYESESIDNTRSIITFKGTVDDLNTSAYLYNTDTGWEESTAETTLNASYDVESQTYAGAGMKAAVTVGNYTSGETTAFSFYVPVEYAQVTDSPINDMLSIMPILVAMGIVLAIVGMCITGRD